MLPSGSTRPDHGLKATWNWPLVMLASEVVLSRGRTVTAKPASLAMDWTSSAKRWFTGPWLIWISTGIGVATPDWAMSSLARAMSRPGHFRSAGANGLAVEIGLQPGS